MATPLAHRFELPALRRQVTVELNKGEARNALARAVCFHRGNHPGPAACSPCPRRVAAHHYAKNIMRHEP